MHGTFRLELLTEQATGQTQGPPLLFIHGAFSGAWQWAPNYLPFFASRGWAVHALSLSGHGDSRGHAGADNFSIDDYVRDLHDVVARLPAEPVLIGHSMGGMVVQKYLEESSAPAAVLMAAVPPQGLLPATFGLAMQRPNVLIDLNRLMSGGAPHLASVREGLFHQPIDDAALMDFLQHCQPESLRAIWDMSLFNLPRPARMHRPPMLVVGAAEDRIIPAGEVERTAQTYGLSAHIFPDMGHAMMLEENWRGPAELIDRWLRETLLT
ncbi:MAG: alpha/beta fold hydrolase [Rhodocyclaceae bacterium]